MSLFLNDAAEQMRVGELVMMTRLFTATLGSAAITALSSQALAEAPT